MTCRRAGALEALAALAALAAACAGPPASDDARLLLRAESALETIRGRLLVPDGSGIALLRELALPSRPPDPGAGRAWRNVADDLVSGAAPEPPVFLSLRAEEGTDLVRWNQIGFVEESYLLRVTVRGRADSGRTLSARLAVAPLARHHPGPPGGAPGPGIFLAGAGEVGALRAFADVTRLGAGSPRWEAARTLAAAGPGTLTPGAPLLRTRGADGMPVAHFGGRLVLGVEGTGPSARLVPLPAPRADSAPPTFGPPALVGSPAALGPRLAGLAGYAAFASAAWNRRPVVYATASDGLLHAFDAETGAELFAFRPRGGVAPGSPLAFEDAAIPGRHSPGEGPCPFAAGVRCGWRTLLAGRSASGGVFVLDVTLPDPGASAPSAPGCLFHGRRDPAPGCAGAFPELVADTALPAGALTLPGFGRARLEDGAVHEVAVAGFAGARSGGLVFLDAATGAPLATMAKPFGTGRAIGPVGTSPAPVDLDGDGLLDAVLFGDAAGQLWKVPLGSGGPAEALPVSAGSAHGPGIIGSPVVLEERGRILVATATSGPGGRIAVVPVAAGSGAPAEPETLASGAPLAGGCGVAAPARPAGFQMPLAGDERIAAPLLALSGYLYAATISGSDGRFRLYRLLATNGDPCRDAECCPQAPGAWEPEGRPVRALEPFPGLSVREGGIAFLTGAGGEPLLVAIVRDAAGGVRTFVRPVPLRVRTSGMRWR